MLYSDIDRKMITCTSIKFNWFYSNDLMLNTYSKKICFVICGFARWMAKNLARQKVNFSV